MRGVLGAAAFLCAVPVSAQESRERPLLITFASVGQGDLVRIVTPEGKQVLIDAGRSAEAAERVLWETWFGDTLDLVVASHNHADHIGGLAWVFGRFHVRAYMDNGIPHTSRAYRSAIAAAEREPGLVYLEATPRTITVGSARLTVLPPARLNADQNDNSVGILLEHGSFRALFTGDSETRQIEHWLRTITLPPVHVLKAAHHGARNGVTAAWIQATRPEVVVVSVSSGNSFGHPAPEVLAAWQHAGAKVFRTDETTGVQIAATRDGKFHVTRGDAWLSSEGKVP